LNLLGYRNDSTNPPVFTDLPKAGLSQRFYRMVATPFITPSVAPTGPLPVGITRRLISDPSRRNRYQISTNGSFMICVWYPANPAAGQIPDRYEEERLAQDVDWQTPLWMDRAPRFSSYSFVDAPIRPIAGGYPVVVHSHGAGSARYENMERAENLASHGYVAVVINHADAGIELFPDDSLYKSSQTVDFTSAAGLQDRVTDVVRTVTDLERMNRDDPILATAMDLNRVAATGFSWGVQTAAEFCRIDSRGKVVVSLDWGTGSEASAPDLLRLGVQKPCLMLNASDNPSRALYDKAISRGLACQKVAGPRAADGDRPRSALKRPHLAKKGTNRRAIFMCPSGTSISEFPKGTNLSMNRPTIRQHGSWCCDKG